MAQNAAQLDPAGPPPTIATSKSCIELIELENSAGARFNQRGH
jgi:hypothetical protein